MSVTSTNRIAVIPLHALANQLQELCWDHSVKLFDSIGVIVMLNNKSDGWIVSIDF